VQESGDEREGFKNRREREREREREKRLNCLNLIFVLQWGEDMERVYM
jgi:hypothetical protein